jgi:site-specific recombinase XerD
LQFQVACNKVPATKKGREARGITRSVECWCDLQRLRAFGKQLGIDNDAPPLFPNPRGKALTKSQVNDVIRKVVQGYDLTISAHTFRITGARWYAKMGIDCPTIALHGRWSSSAVMTYEYLAGAPLTSLKAKMRPPRLLSDATAREVLQSQNAMKSGTGSRLLGKQLHRPILWRKMQSSRDMC